MLEPSTPDDEAGRFLSVYDVFGGSDPESTREPVTTATPATLTTGAPSSSTAEPVANTTSQEVNLAPSTPAASPAAPVSPTNQTAPGTPGATNREASTPEEPTGANVAQVTDRDTAHRGPSRWIVTGVMAGLAFGFVQGNVDFVPGTTATVSSASPQMLTAAGSDTVSTQPSTPVVTADISSMVNAELANARRYYDTTGTFTGWRPAAPMLGATGGPYVVIIVDVDGVCYSTGIAPGYDNGIDIDPSGARCDVNTLNALQRKLDTIG